MPTKVGETLPLKLVVSGSVSTISEVEIGTELRKKDLAKVPQKHAEVLSFLQPDSLSFSWSLCYSRRALRVLIETDSHMWTSPNQRHTSHLRVA